MWQNYNDLLEQTDTQTVRIEALAAEDKTARRLKTLPGVSLLTALAVEAFAPPIENLQCGWDFAAWLGLAPASSSPVAGS